mgnify:FL=1
MQTPTLDHTDPTPVACGCTPCRLCTLCMGRLQRVRYDYELRDWLERWGNRPDPKAPRR